MHLNIHQSGVLTEPFGHYVAGPTRNCCHLSHTLCADHASMHQFTVLLKATCIGCMCVYWNLPPALLADWPGPFTFYSSDNVKDTHSCTNSNLPLSQKCFLWWGRSCSCPGTWQFCPQSQWARESTPLQWTAWECSESKPEDQSHFWTCTPMSPHRRNTKMLSLSLSLGLSKWLFAKTLEVTTQASNQDCSSKTNQPYR